MAGQKDRRTGFCHPRAGQVQGAGRQKGVAPPHSTFLLPRGGRQVIGNDPKIPLLLLLCFWSLLLGGDKDPGVRPCLAQPSTPYPCSALTSPAGGCCCWSLCFCWNFSSFSRFFASFLSWAAVFGGAGLSGPAEGMETQQACWGSAQGSLAQRGLCSVLKADAPAHPTLPT